MKFKVLFLLALLLLSAQAFAACSPLLSSIAVKHEGGDWELIAFRDSPELNPIGLDSIRVFFNTQGLCQLPGKAISAEVKFGNSVYRVDMEESEQNRIIINVSEVAVLKNLVSKLKPNQKVTLEFSFRPVYVGGREDLIALSNPVKLVFKKPECKTSLISPAKGETVRIGPKGTTFRLESTCEISAARAVLTSAFNAGLGCEKTPSSPQGNIYLCGLSANSLIEKFKGQRLDNVPVEVMYKGESDYAKADGSADLEIADCSPKGASFQINGREIGENDYIKFSELQDGFDNVTIETGIDTACGTPKNIVVGLRSGEQAANDAWLADAGAKAEIVLGKNVVFKRNGEGRTVDQLLKQLKGKAVFTVTADYEGAQGYGSTRYEVMVNPPEICTASVTWPSQTIIGSGGLKGIVVTPSEGCEIEEVTAKAVGLSGGIWGIGATQTELGDISFECTGNGDKKTCNAEPAGFAQDGIRGEAIYLQLKVTFTKNATGVEPPLSPQFAVVDCTPMVKSITFDGKFANEYVSLEKLKDFQVVHITYHIDSACKADNAAAPKIFIQGENGKWELACGRTQNSSCTRVCTAEKCTVEIKKDAQFSKGGSTQKPALSGLLSGEAFLLGKEASFSVVENFEGLGLSYGESEKKTLLMGRPPQCSASLVPPSSLKIATGKLEFGITTNCPIESAVAMVNGKTSVEVAIGDFESENTPLKANVAAADFVNFAGKKVDLSIKVKFEGSAEYTELKPTLKSIEVIDCTPAINGILINGNAVPAGDKEVTVLVDELQSLALGYEIPAECKFKSPLETIVKIGSLTAPRIKRTAISCNNPDYGCKRNVVSGTSYSLELKKSLLVKNEGIAAQLTDEIVPIAEALQHLNHKQGVSQTEITLTETFEGGMSLASQAPIRLVGKPIPTCTIKSAKIGDVALAIGKIITLGAETQNLILEVEGEGCGEITELKWSVADTELNETFTAPMPENGKLTVQLEGLTQTGFAEGQADFSVTLTGPDSILFENAMYSLIFVHPAPCEIRIRSVDVEYVVNKGTDNEELLPVTLSQAGGAPVLIRQLGSISTITIHYSLPELEGCGNVGSYLFGFGEYDAVCRKIEKSPFLSVDSLTFKGDAFTHTSPAAGTELPETYLLGLYAYSGENCSGTAGEKPLARGLFPVKDGRLDSLAEMLKAAEPSVPNIVQLFLEKGWGEVDSQEGKIEITQEELDKESRIGVLVEGIGTKGERLHLSINAGTDAAFAIDDRLERYEVGRAVGKTYYIKEGALSSLGHYTLMPSYSGTIRKGELVGSLVWWIDKETFEYLLVGDSVKFTAWQDETKKKEVTILVAEPPEEKRSACEISNFVIKVNYDNTSAKDVKSGMIFTSAKLNQDPSNSTKKLKFLDSEDKVLFEIDYGSAKPFANQLAANKDKVAAVRFEIYAKDNLNEPLCSETWKPAIRDQVEAGKPVYTFVASQSGARLDFFAMEVLNVVVKSGNGTNSAKLVEILGRGTANARIYQVVEGKETLLDTKAPIVNCSNGDCTIKFEEFPATFGDYRVKMDLKGSKENTRIPISFELNIRQK